MPSDPHSFDELKLPFIFVPHGAPDPTEWQASHYDWIKLPATLEPDPQSDAQAGRASDGSPLDRRDATDGLAPQPVSAAARPSAGTARSDDVSNDAHGYKSAATFHATNEPSGNVSIPVDPIAAFGRANAALTTAARGPALDVDERRTGAQLPTPGGRTDQ